MAKKYKVKVPVDGFKGERLGVKFVDGAAEVSEKTARKLLQEYPNYSCPELEEKTPETPEAPKPKEIEDYKKQILLDTAKEVLKRDFVDRIHKDDLVIEILEEIQAQSVENAEIESAFLAHAKSLDK
ncbi:MAG: hypothetical protein H8E26_14150 [FCB group bacterium]|nr:hypothetical protein [FCB group bacterium]MBL7027426.1 hypothetical protein [Candidatus Neomarinimicrobiota bacterium]MBL7122592.1 hypothetical protein [Candidatus Neomarinimicrobiota bacterium]